jgi:hypothetical protein
MYKIILIAMMLGCLFSTKDVVSQPRYLSEAAIFLPPDLADRADYTTYSQKEFHNYLSQKAGKDNSFIGNKVKVFARYHPENTNFINRTRLPAWKQSTACQIELCDSLERLTTHRNDLESIAQGSSIDLSNFTTGIYFFNSEKYKKFLTESTKRCSFMYPCYVWVLGKLGFVKGPRKYQGLINLDLRIAYIDVEDVLMIDGNDNAAIEILTAVVPLANRAKAISVGFKSVLR